MNFFVLVLCEPFEAITESSLMHIFLPFSFCPCRHDCGFFMLQVLQSWDGENFVIFKQDDILSIRMTLLYSWLTAPQFNIDLKSVIGVDPGIIFLYFTEVFFMLLFFS